MKNKPRFKKNGSDSQKQSKLTLEEFVKCALTTYIENTKELSLDDIGLITHFAGFVVHCANGMAKNGVANG